MTENSRPRLPVVNKVVATFLGDDLEKIILCDDLHNSNLLSANQHFILEETQRSDGSDAQGHLLTSLGLRQEHGVGCLAAEWTCKRLSGCDR